ncbi:MAG: metallophosphoesterase [Bacteroidales bacterium]|nr:metallophosphoesterase [Bacteroidales bacterium]
MKQIIFILIAIIFLASVDMYLAEKFIWFFNIPNKTLIYISFSSLIIYCLSGVFLRNLSGKLNHFLYTIAATGLGVLLYFLFSNLVFDFINLFVNITPYISGIATISLTFFLSIFGIIHAKTTSINNLEIKIKGLKNNLKIVHLSDIHVGHFRGAKFMNKIVNIVNKLNADLIFITGDFFDSKSGLKAENSEPLSNFNAPAYFVEGNHDNYSGIEKAKAFIKQNNVIILENEVVNIKDIQIIGLKHMSADENTQNFHTKFKKETIKSTLASLNIDKSKPSILLHHSPDGIDYANEAGIDLYLTGHTHSGQLFPINIITSLIFKYNRGLHNYKNTKIFISQGIGTTNPPMRVGTKSEIVQITLKAE